jgi:hypothetical protein
MQRSVVDPADTARRSDDAAGQQVAAEDREALQILADHERTEAEK